MTNIFLIKVSELKKGYLNVNMCNFFTTANPGTHRISKLNIKIKELKILPSVENHDW